ncbi:MAG TPA: hypothetical protein VLF62_00035 [Candidatus Saccharimonadales bacterium]|nr:hypothetical protein [Candidatus Saccharimonadales bacterium]
MHEELHAEINNYQFHWKDWIAHRTHRDFFEQLQPTGIGWKTADMAEFDKRFAVLRAHSDQVHLGWVNKRWIATFVLREPLAWNIRIVKLMQRRAGVNDPVGLDHLDFLVGEGLTADHLKTQDPELNVTDEENGEHCKWVSIWFKGSEAKLRSDTTLDVCITEMQHASKELRAAVLQQPTGNANGAQPA